MLVFAVPTYHDAPDDAFSKAPIGQAIECPRNGHRAGKIPATFQRLTVVGWLTLKHAATSFLLYAENFIFYPF
jgi:hypothetical protein